MTHEQTGDGRRAPAYLTWLVACSIAALPRPLGAVDSPPTSVWQASVASRPALEAQADADRLADPAAEVTVLFEEASYRFDAQGRLHYRFRRVFRPRTAEAAAGWAEVAATYAPWHQAQPVLRGRVVSRDLKVHVLDPRTVAEEPAIVEGDKVYSDRRVVRAPLPGIEAGALVEEEIERTDTRPLFAAGTVLRQRAFSRFPVLERRVVVASPDSLAARLQPRLGAPAPTVEQRQGEVWQEIRIIDARGTEDPEENQVPPELAPGPQYLVSTGRSWAEVAAAYSRIVDEQIADADVSALTVGVAAGAAPAEASRAILERLKALVRYSGVEFGEASIVPWTPAHVLERRYGDCKDQAALLVAALRAVGQTAHVALLRTDWNGEVDAEAPGLGDFDHAIVAVRAGDGLLWIDPTADDPRIDLLPAADQGRISLVSDPSTVGLVKTSESTAADNRIVETRFFELARRGAAAIVETSEYHGGSIAQRPVLPDQPTEADLRSLRQYAEREYLSDKVKVDPPPPPSSSGAATFQMRVAEARRGSTDSAEAVVAILPSTFLQPFPPALTRADEAGSERKRTQPFLFWEPFTYEWRYRIVPPRGYVAKKTPETSRVELGPASLTTEFRVEPDGTVTGAFTLDSGPRRVSAADFDAMRSALGRLGREKALLVTFQHPAEIALVEGRLPEALSAFRALLEAQPGDAHTRARYARALVTAGFGDAARREAQRAGDEAPEEAEAHGARGWVLQHDPIGRRYAQRADLTGAAAAYRKALELAPANDDLGLELAILLEHADRGQRYRDPDGLKQAIALYEGMQERLASTPYADNLPIALLRAGRADRAEEQWAKLTPNPSRHAMRILAASLNGGLPLGLSRAAEIVGGPAERRQAIEAAGQTAAAMRHYELASQLTSEAARGADNSTAILARASLQRRIRRHDAERSDPRQPVGFVQDLLRALALDDSDPSSRSVDEGLIGDEDESAGTLQDAMRVLRSGIRAVNPDRDVALDIALSLNEFFVDGSDRVGYRVKMRSSVLPDPLKVFLLRRRPDSELRLVATEQAVSGAGLEARRHLGATDAAGAAQWLDWATEILPPVSEGDDPLGAALVTAFWSPRGERQAPLAAAALLLGSASWDEALETFAGALREDAADAPPVERGLAIALLRAKRYREAADLSSRLVRRYPRSATAFVMHVSALREFDLAAARRVAQARLAESPGDPWALRTLAQIEERDGDVARSTSHYKQLIASEHVLPLDYNNLAWEGMLAGEPTDQLLDWARRAVDLTASGNSNVLNTLATLYAESGAPKQALELVWRSMTIDGAEEPRPPDLYVVGRMAETYGLLDVARATYALVPPPREGEAPAVSVRALADRRLKALQ